ncbi:hypothetical protein SLA2020_001250 [Shorea laevis]
MNLSSWFRRDRSTSKNPEETHQSNQRQEQEEELLGVTDQLIDYIKSFTLDTFKSFPLQDDEGAANGDETQKTSSTNVQKDLSDWQERHAIFVLSKVKELAQLRFTLCPRHMKEGRFWRIYFALVKTHVAEYELHAIQQAKLKNLKLAMENEKEPDTSPYEVEMAERLESANLAPSTP